MENYKLDDVMVGIFKDVQNVKILNNAENYIKPPISLLKDNTNLINNEISEEESNNIHQVLEKYARIAGIFCVVRDIVKGPTVYSVDVELLDNYSLNYLNKDSLTLQALFRTYKPLNIHLSDTNPYYVTIEIPLGKTSNILLKDIIIDSDSNKNGNLICSIGKTMKGEKYNIDLFDYPFSCVAGISGSGKSMFLNTIIMNLIMNYSPNDLQLLLIDLKNVEMNIYSNLPHVLFGKSLGSPDEIMNALKWLYIELNNRIRLLAQNHCRNIYDYNKKENVDKIKDIVVIIDEAYELCIFNKRKTEFIEIISNISRIGRCAGIKIIYATQNISKKVITEEINNNFNTKFIFKVDDSANILYLLKEKGAEKLVGCGDMLVKHGASIIRIQAPYISIDEIESVVSFIAENNVFERDDSNFNYILSGTFLNDLQSLSNPSKDSNNEDDENEENTQTDKYDISMEARDGVPLKYLALKYIIDNGNYVSLSFLQRKLRIGFNNSACIIDRLVEDGLLKIEKNINAYKKEYSVAITKEDLDKILEKYNYTDPND